MWGRETDSQLLSRPHGYHLTHVCVPKHRHTAQGHQGHMLTKLSSSTEAHRTRSQPVRMATVKR